MKLPRNKYVRWFLICVALIVIFDVLDRFGVMEWMLRSLLWGK